ncbi:SMI1/KNR4 family protein [Streptomyces sp. ISL-43]|uniref:HEAT repeat domain-containing protein n=1 Tax=Streptomyces sp. ISL-43 TaxID=2819183 RepID=UPI001BE87D1E|nr:HEAT repeat domain-containing protein [Streptomyces sp. ISL-43]MBT2450825.1 SMI1/KNR4 family protein [Streptomyces sp. ISL-43]
MDARINRIRTKLSMLPDAEKAVLGPVLTEAQISEFEDTHGVRLPEEFRRFLTRIGHGGYGPTYGLLPMEKWTGQPGTARLAEPFPIVPDLDVPTGPDDRGDLTGSFPGTIEVVYRGCSDSTLLVVTGPGRGRLVEANGEGFFAPRFHADPDFLSWYERWLDFVLTGHHNLNWFADQMAGSEVQLVATLLGDELPARRRAAAYTFITHPEPSVDLPGRLLRALTTEPHPAVRETILRALAAQGEHGRDLLTRALTDPVPGVRALAAILMTTRTPQAWHLPPRLREVLGRHLANETDDSVRDAISRTLDLT